MESGFNRTASVVDGADFAQGCGNVVNNGDWTKESHGSEGRVGYFDHIIDMFKDAGMTSNMPRG